MSEEAFIEAPSKAPNVGDPVTVRTIERLLADKADQTKSDLVALLKMPEGRRFIWRVLERCQVYGSTHSHVHAEAAFLEGQRQIGTAVIAWLTAVEPLAYPRLMAEGREDRATDEAILAARLAEAKERERKSSGGG